MTRTFRRICTSVALLLIVSGVIGCGEKLVPISGTVSVKGVPVEEGSIRFVPADGGAPQGSAIRQGKYEAMLSPGDVTVEIQGSKKVGERKYVPSDPSSPMVPVMEQVVPPKYQRNSPLKETITEENDNLNFDLDPT